MYIDKLIKREVITLLISVSLLVIIFIGITYAKFLSVDKGQDTVINVGDLNISFCNDSSCDSTYTNIGQVIGTKIENGKTVPSSIYPFKNDSSYSNETPYIFKVENTGSLDSTIKIKLKEDATFTPSGDYSNYARLTSKYASHLKVAIKKRVLYKDTGYQLGDVNMDGIVNKKDEDTIFDIIFGRLTPSSMQEKLADVMYDNTIDADDIDTLERYLTCNNCDGTGSFYIYSYTELENGVIFKDDIIKSGESAIYFLWLYLDDTTPNDVQKTYFVGNIDVDGEYNPDVPAPVNFSTDSWKTIVSAVRNNNISKYNVGDTKEIDMGSYGTHTLRIANTSTPSECSTNGFSQTACGFVLEFVDVVTMHAMNDTATNVGGWPATSMRMFVNNDIYNAIPSEIKNAIIDTTVVSGHGSDDSANFTSTDKLYLLATAEVWDKENSTTINYDTAQDITRQLDYYKKMNVTTSNGSEAVKENDPWLRSSHSNTDDRFYGVNSFGDEYDSEANIEYGVSPAFRIG